MRKLFAVLVVLILPACASNTIEPLEYRQSAAKHIPAMERGKAQACFLRDYYWNYLNIQPDLTINDVKVGTLYNGKFVCKTVNPGNNTFTADSSVLLGEPKLSKQVNAGQRIFLEWDAHEYLIFHPEYMQEIDEELGLSKIYRITR